MQGTGLTNDCNESPSLHQYAYMTQALNDSTSSKLLYEAEK